MLVPVAPDLWEVTRPLSTLGLQIGTRMTVLRLADGSVALVSPIAVDDAEKAAIDALGPVSAIVVPNTMHTLFFRDAARRWPSARLHGPPALHARFTELPWAESAAPSDDALDAHLFAGARKHAETVLLHRPSRSIVFTDIVFHYPAKPDWFTGMYVSMAKVLGRVGVTPLGKTVFDDRKAARGSADTLIAWEAERIVVAHGSPWSGDVRAALTDAFAFLG